MSIIYIFKKLITFSILNLKYIMCVCLFSALSRRVGALQISIIINHNDNLKPSCNKHIFRTVEEEQGLCIRRKPYTLPNWSVIVLSQLTEGTIPDTGFGMTLYQCMTQIVTLSGHSCICWRWQIMKPKTNCASTPNMEETKGGNFNF